MSESPLKRILVYVVIIVGVVGAGMGITYALTSPENADYKIPEVVRKSRHKNADLVITILNPDGKPVPTAQVRATWRTPKSGRGYKKTFTDINGITSMDLNGAKLKYFDITIKSSGYVTTFQKWGSRNLNSTEEIPSEVTVTLKRGKKIGGRVLSKTGTPISGAKIRLRQRAQEEDTDLYTMVDETASTNKEGRWQITNAPDNLQGLRLQVSHSGHVSTNRWKTFSSSQLPELEKSSYITRMEKGILLTGTVTDTAGKPIEGVTVTLGPDPWDGDTRNYRPTTDENGNFRYKKGRIGRNMLTFLSLDYAPKTHQLNIKKTNEDILIQLDEGKRLEFEIKSDEGKPLSNATVWPQQWQGTQNLSILLQNKNRLVSDSKGIVVWEHAPTDEVNFYIAAEKFMGTNGSYAPIGKPHQIVMSKTKKVIVKVLDAATGKPLPKFKYYMGYGYNNGRNQRYHWQQHDQRHGENGEFTYELNDANQSIAFRVLAPKHKPAITEGVNTGDVTGASLELEVKLEEGIGPKGVILSADGKPVPKANVVLFTPNGQAQLYNGEAPEWSRSPQTQTDKEGKFEFDPQDDTFGLIAFNESGYIRLKDEEIPKNGEIKLEPWASLTGTLMEGDKPAANRNVSIYFQDLIYEQNAPRIHINYSTETDETGKFTFEKVPGEVAIFRKMQEVERSNGRRHQISSNIARFELESGKTKEVSIGGSGRPVIGKVALPEGKTIGWVQLNVMQQTKPTAVDMEAAGSQVIGGFLSQLSEYAGVKTKKEEKKKPTPPFNSYYQMHLTEEGTFKAPEIPPGNYRLDIQVYEKVGNNEYANHLGSLNHNFEVPEPKEGEPKFISEELDLGELKFKDRSETNQFRGAF